MNLANTITDTLRTLAYRWLTKGMPDIYGTQSMPNFFGTGNKMRTKKEQLENFRSWVYSCVDTRAKEVQAAEFQVLQRTRQNEFKEVGFDHPLIRLLSDPNPYFTKTEILYVSVVHLDLTGDCFWYTPLNGLGVPAEVWVLPVDKVKIIPGKKDDESFVSHYELNIGHGNTMRFGAEEIVHLRYPNPTDMYYGMSVLKAANYAADINNYQHEYQRHFYRNYATPDIAFVTLNKLDGDTAKRFKADLQKQYGGGEKRGLAMLLEGGMDVKRIGVTPKELNWLVENRATMQEIAGIFKVPPSKIGQEDVPNRAVAEASEYSFSKGTIEPILTMFDERLTQDLAREFDERLVVRHKSTVREDEERRARVDQIRISSGQLTINESRKSQGLDEVEGGDEILVPTSLRKLNEVEQE